MSINYEPDYKALENNIIDVIKEEQIKLGYTSETIRLYYPMESLNNLLGAELSITDLQSVLAKFCVFTKMRLGNVEYSNKDTRFCFVIPPVGVTYVHEEVEENIFLTEFINKIREHDCSYKDLLEVFHRYSDNVKSVKMTNEEFDYLIYFEDGQPDDYQYCIKFEDGHTIYHRYTKTDYEKFGF